MEYMKYAFKKNDGLILSASIEKGVLPVMVLGETGIVGSIFFWLFIFTFYATCARKKYYCCATLHTVFFATNMAESTYFSPFTRETDADSGSCPRSTSSASTDAAKRPGTR